MPEARILLADDQSIVIKGLRAVLEEDASFTVVAEAGNGRAAVTLCETLQPDVAIVDIAMPQLNGIEAARQIHRVSAGTKVLMLSMHCDESYILRALAAGARGYLLKDSVEEELLTATRTILKGSTYFSPAISKRFSEEYLRRLRQRNLQDSYEMLTDREREVLQLLAEGRSNKEVAALLSISLSTVDTHRMNLMQKLDLHSTADIVLYAVRKNLII